ncbi:MAG: FAD-binding domain-containing protein [Hyphomicrobiales bacterium]
MSNVQKFNASREAAMRRLAEFLPRSGRAYAERRNYDFGAGKHTAVSQLSPYIRHRLILEEEVIAAVLTQFAPSSAEKFIQEVFWRTYWKGWLEQRPGVWTSYQEGLASAVSLLSTDGSMAETYERASSGKTGIEAFDEWAIELINTGYMHNHARMWFASIWIFTLKLPWQLGADFFYRHLLDGDPASNTLSWRWVGGLHTRGKTYLARPSNIQKYTNGRFKPQGLAGTTPPLELDDVPPMISISPRKNIASDVPFVLLVTEEDMVLESLVTTSPRAIIGVQLTHLRSTFEVSPNVSSFIADALVDTVMRAKAHFKVPQAEMIPSADMQEVITVLKANDCKTLVTAYAALGPVAAWLERLEDNMRLHGMKLVKLRRDYDEKCWPHAKKGFFPFKENIPGFLKHIETDRMESILAEYSSEPRLL